MKVNNFDMDKYVFGETEKPKSFDFSDYINSRDQLKKDLFYKLMIDRFDWEIVIEDEKYLIETPITQEEKDEKVKLVEKVIRHMIFEYEKYLFLKEENLANFSYRIYLPTPTLLCLNTLSVDWTDSNTSEVYEVDPVTFERIDSDTMQ